MIVQQLNVLILSTSHTQLFLGIKDDMYEI